MLSTSTVSIADTTGEPIASSLVVREDIDAALFDAPLSPVDRSPEDAANLSRGETVEWFSTAAPDPLDLPILATYSELVDEVAVGQLNDSHPSDEADSDAVGTIGGWIAQGFTYNPNQPSNSSNRPVLFNDRANEYLLDQVYLYAESPIVGDGTDWELGSRIDFVYGYDSHFVTVPGLERHHDRTRKWNGESERHGAALPQAYVVLGVPGGSGLSIKLGHFYAPGNYESFAAADNLLYSHSYAYGYGSPFTFTGVQAEYSPSDSVTWRLGYNRGWDVWDSSAGEWGVFTGVDFHSANHDRELSFVVNAGEDITNTIVGGVPMTDDRQWAQLTYKHRLAQEWRFVVNAVYGNQQSAVVVANVGPSTITFDSAQWYGVNQLLIWEPNDWWAGVLRFEWFRDEDHSRIGTPLDFNPGGPVLTGANFFALTAGLNCRLTPNAVLRPEVRWDWSDVRGSATVPGGDPSVRAFGDRTDGSQLTLATDLVIRF